jgi:hypothetical protein
MTRPEGQPVYRSTPPSFWVLERKQCQTLGKSGGRKYPEERLSGWFDISQVAAISLLELRNSFP